MDHDEFALCSFTSNLDLLVEHNQRYDGRQKKYQWKGDGYQMLILKQKKKNEIRTRSYGHDTEEKHRNAPKKNIFLA